ncbi:hypothetical protein V6N13_034974 [Hibiscus sabdariffa]
MIPPVGGKESFVSVHPGSVGAGSSKPGSGGAGSVGSRLYGKALSHHIFLSPGGLKKDITFRILGDLRLPALRPRGVGHRGKVLRTQASKNLAIPTSFLPAAFSIFSSFCLHTPTANQMSLLSKRLSWRIGLRTERIHSFTSIFVRRFSSRLSDLKRSRGIQINARCYDDFSRLGSDPIPAVKLLPDPAHLPLKLECLFIEEATLPEESKVPIRARAQTGEARTRSGRRPAAGSSTKRRTARCLFSSRITCAGSLGEEKQATFAYLPSISIGGNGKSCELLKLSREYQMLTVTKVTDFRWTRSQRVQSNSVTSLRLQKRSPTLIVGPKGRTLLLTCYIPAFLHGSARSSSPASPFPLSPFLPSKTGRMEYSQVVRHRFLVPACKGSNPFTPDYEDPIGSVKNDYRGSG